MPEALEKQVLVEQQPLIIRRIELNDGIIFEVAQILENCYSEFDDNYTRLYYSTRIIDSNDNVVFDFSSELLDGWKLAYLFEDIDSMYVSNLYQKINIPLSRLHDNGDIILILHEIGHLRFTEANGFISINDPTQERYAWAWAIRKARTLKEKYGIDLFEGFGDYEGFIRWLHQDDVHRLGSFEKNNQESNGRFSWKYYRDREK